MHVPLGAVCSINVVASRNSSLSRSDNSKPNQCINLQVTNTIVRCVIADRQIHGTLAQECSMHATSR
jgi:hypothetical protein